MISERREHWQLRAPMPVLRRPDGVLQLGLEPPAGILLGHLPPTADRVLDALAGPCTMRRLSRIGGASSARWLPGVLTALDAAGLLRRPRPSGPVTVIGTDRLALLLIELLLDVADGPVHAVWPDAPAPPAALAELQRLHPNRIRFSGHVGGPERAPSGLSLVCVRALEADRAVLRQVGGPHLIVACSDLGAAVGPLVVPGCTACLRCEDLHRLERDSAWPELLLQLSRSRSSDAGPADLHWAAGVAVLHATSWLAGGVPDSMGAGLVLDLDGALRVRPLRAHPGCGCGAAR
ncbi:MAG: hypothetical protein QM695_08200 [Micropruina sp.]